MKANIGVDDESGLVHSWWSPPSLGQEHGKAVDIVCVVESVDGGRHLLSNAGEMRL